MRANPECSKTTGRRNRKGKRAQLNARAPRRLQFEPLEDRTLLAVTLSNPSTAWTSLGPTAIVNDQTVNLPLQNSPVAGAITAFATAAASAAANAPTVAFAATANGGVWETNDLNNTEGVDINQVNDPNLITAPPSVFIQAGPDLGAGVGPLFSYKATFVYAGGVESNANSPVQRRRISTAMSRSPP